MTLKAKEMMENQVNSRFISGLYPMAASCSSSLSMEASRMLVLTGASSPAASFVAYLAMAEEGFGGKGSEASTEHVGEASKNAYLGRWIRGEGGEGRCSGGGAKGEKSVGGVLRGKGLWALWGTGVWLVELQAEA